MLAVDASPEAIAINRERLQAPNVEYCLSDIFSWVPPTAFDLNDQREFHIVKVFHEPSILERRLNGGGWDGWVRSSGRFFLYGSVRPVQENG